MKIHIDLDCFFVSAERTVDASLMGKPVGVGGRADQNIFSRTNTKQTMSLQNHGAFVMSFFQEHQSSGHNDIKKFIDPDGRIRGILTTSSYEARAFDIKTGTTINEALKKCPNIIIKQPNMKLYQKLSHELNDYLVKKIPSLEQASIDEFYGDLEGWIEDKNVPRFIEQLRDDILKDLNLPVSIGAAQSKYTAKLATNFAKPFGVKTVYFRDVDTFIHNIKIEKFPGIGAKTYKKLSSYGLRTLGDIQASPALFQNQTKSVWDLYLKVCGIDTTPIKIEHIRKSIGISRTFDSIIDRRELKRRLIILSRHLAYAVLKMEVIPMHFTLSLSYTQGLSAKATFSGNRLFSEKLMKDIATKLLYEADKYPHTKVIRISISTSQFTVQTHQTLSLIDFEEDTKYHQLSTLSKSLRLKYGLDILRWGSEL